VTSPTGWGAKKKGGAKRLPQKPPMVKKEKGVGQRINTPKSDERGRGVRDKKQRRRKRKTWAGYYSAIDLGEKNMRQQA